MKYLFLVLFSLSLLACKHATTIFEETKARIPANNIVQKHTSNPDTSSKDLKKHFSGEELAAILEIKQAFDTGLVNGKEVTNYAQEYKNHAHRMRADYFNKFPYTLNFPYNDKFDLSHVPAAVSKLSFLSNKCGFADTKNNTTIHHYCFEAESTYQSFLAALATENKLIQLLVDDYKKNKTISKDAKYAMLINSYEDLDFEKIEHQITYLFFQIIVNEERLAVKKLQKGSPT